MEGHGSHFPGCGCAGFEVSSEDDNLFDVIDLKGVQCLNELKGGSCKLIFRDEPDRKKFAGELNSPKDDSEFLVIVPFTEEIKLRAVSLICSDESKRPSSVRLYINEENFDYGLVDDDPVQEVVFNNWTSDNQSEAYPTITKFVRVQKLCLHFKNEDADQIGLVYLGLKGIRTKAKKYVVKANYEGVPMLEDHKKELEALNKGNAQNMF